DAPARTIELRAPASNSGKTPPPTSSPVAPAKGTSPGTQVYTLRIKDVPLAKLIDVLREKHGLDIRTNDEAIRGAGLSLERLTEVNVERATLEALLEQAAAPLGLTAKRVGDTVEIGPR